MVYLWLTFIVVLVVYVDFNLVQLFIANKFSIKEQKRYNGKYTHYTEIFPWKSESGKPTSSIFIHTYIVYNTIYI